jgi:aspartyl-tRNA(Asn)/glutamyl-tRNA(Gln) amidotransferase subunit A
MALDPQQLTTTIYTAEGSHYLKPIIAGREEELSLPMHRRMAWPAPEFSDYLDALQDVERLKQATATLFDRYDLLLCPSAPIPANPHDPISLDAGIAEFPPSTITVDGQQVAGRNALRATIPADFTGSPAISVPFGWSNDGLPIGVQLIGPHMAEAALLQAASALERLGDTAGRRPPV